MIRNLIFVAMLIFGVAGAVVELSGTDPAIFDQPTMTKDGVGRDMGSVTWGTPTGWNNAADGTPYGDKQPALTGSLAKEAYFNSKPADLPSTADQVEAYLNETLNRSGVTVVDALNVTEGV